MLVRHFVPCQEVVERDDERFDLRGVAGFVELPAGVRPPCIVRLPFVIFLAAAGVRKPTTISVQWVFVADQNYTLEAAGVTIPPAPTPADEVQMPLRFDKLYVREAGQYEVRLWCGGEVAASVSIMVEAS